MNAPRGPVVALSPLDERRPNIQKSAGSETGRLVPR
jgi:hypothetical protein